MACLLGTEEVGAIGMKVLAHVFRGKVRSSLDKEGVLTPMFMMPLAIGVALADITAGAEGVPFDSLFGTVTSFLSVDTKVDT